MNRNLFTRNFYISFSLFLVLSTISSVYLFSIYEPDYDAYEPIAGFDYIHYIPTGSDPEDYPLNHTSTSTYEDGQVHLKTTYYPEETIINLIVSIFTVRGFVDYQISENSSILSIQEYDLENDNPSIEAIPEGYRYLLLIELDIDLNQGYFQFDGEVFLEPKLMKFTFGILFSLAIGITTFMMLELQTTHRPEIDTKEEYESLMPHWPV